MALLASGGLAYGVVIYMHRSTVREVNVASNNAIMVHLLLAALMVSVVAAIEWRSRLRGRSARELWLAPVGQRAFDRTKDTLLLGRGITVGAILRVPISLFLLFLLLWEPFRGAAQVFH